MVWGYICQHVNILATSKGLKTDEALERAFETMTRFAQDVASSQDPHFVQPGLPTWCKERQIRGPATGGYSARVPATVSQGKRPPRPRRRYVRQIAATGGLNNPHRTQWVPSAAKKTLRRYPSKGETGSSHGGAIGYREKAIKEARREERKISRQEGSRRGRRRRKGPLDRGTQPSQRRRWHLKIKTKRTRKQTTKQQDSERPRRLRHETVMPFIVPQTFSMRLFHKIELRKSSSCSSAIPVVLSCIFSK